MTVSDTDQASNNDYQAIVAVADGTPYINMNAAHPYLWNAEQGKTWTTLDNTLNVFGTQTATASACLPPGNYTLQYWDVCGGGGNCPAGFGFNAGTPPDTTYGSGWEIGDPSALLIVTAGGNLSIGLAATHTNVPAYDNFYGGYGLWTYGACDAGQACTPNATCYNGGCVDLNYDIRNCGTGGNECDAGSCCVGACTDVGSDPNNCGGCGVQCGPGSECSSAQCVAVDAGCAVLAVAVTRDLAADPTDYEGLFAVENGRPYLQDGADNQKVWPAEQAKLWFPLNTELFSQETATQVFSACVPPGNYTVQFWNDGCVNNLGGCGTYSNGTPPASYTYLWQIGDASRSLPVTLGAITGATLVRTSTDVPVYDNFYGSYAVWSYGGCGTYCAPDGQCQTPTCPSGTTCSPADGECYDLGYDIRNCGSPGFVIVDGGSCCEGQVSDISQDPANCGGCGFGCDSGLCSAGVCH